MNSINDELIWVRLRTPHGNELTHMAQAIIFT